MNRLMLSTFLCVAPLGHAYAQHMNSPNSPCKDASTAALVQCLNKALATADAKLNKTYSRVQTVLEPDEVEALKKAQRFWIQFRDATCDAEKGLYGGGSGGSPAYLACVEAQTRTREADLLATYGWRLEK